MEPELIADYSCRTGESPLWHPGEGRLYWADIPKGRLYYYDPGTGLHGMAYEGEIVGGYTIQADGALLFMLPRGAVRAWKGGVTTTLLEDPQRARHAPQRLRRGPSRPCLCRHRHHQGSPRQPISDRP